MSYPCVDMSTTNDDVDFDISTSMSTPTGDQQFGGMTIVPPMAKMAKARLPRFACVSSCTVISYSSAISNGNSPAAIVCVLDSHTSGANVAGGIVGAFGSTGGMRMISPGQGNEAIESQPL